MKFQVNLRRLIVPSVDACLLSLSLWAAFALRLADLWPTTALETAGFLFLVTPLLGVLALTLIGFYRSIVRFMSDDAIKTLSLSICLLALLQWGYVELFAIDPFSKSIIIISAVISFLAIGATRFFLREYYRWLEREQKTHKAVLIYGAGSAGYQLARSLKVESRYLLVGFVDDNSLKHGRSVAGVKVYDSANIQKIVANMNVSEVLMALPSVAEETRNRIAERLLAIGVKVKTMPSIAQIMSGDDLRNLHEISIYDILERHPVAPKPDLIEKSLSGRTVLVSGGGGSIGSELCRQAVLKGCRLLVILDSSEFALYRIHQELSVLVDAQPNPVRLVPVLGNVLSKTLLSKVFSDFNIDTVYHAAAYKHVPLVESNPVEGFINNVIGTLNLAKLSRENSVDRFVLISTDKAVRPTNVMGATKRIAELVVCGLASGSTDTRFSVVRFGNVLGSSGSVVPLFQRQIAEGGPVTVTDPNVIRYFMTIPEAALLVVQAGSLAKGGEIFLLDMGKAVKIVDLARKMIRLAGYKSTLTAPKDGEIQIEFCGLRPGEKLYEELLIDGNPIASSHPKIFYAKEPVLDLDAFQVLLDQLSDTEKLTHDRLRQILREYVPGYLPTIEEDLADEP